MVFQNFALWPHLRVIDTVAYPLRRRGHSRQDARATATELLDGLGIAHLAERRPAELSGGEQQRVGLARALARKARLYLLDEPTAHLDTHLRAAFQESVLARRVTPAPRSSTPRMTPREALALADRVALIDDGRLIQIGTPADVYEEPVSGAAAVLSGPCSLLAAVVCAAGDGLLSVDLGDGPIVVPGGGTRSEAPLRRQLLVRPDWVTRGRSAAGRGHSRRLPRPAHRLPPGARRPGRSCCSCRGRHGTSSAS